MPSMMGAHALFPLPHMLRVCAALAAAASAVTCRSRSDFLRAPRAAQPELGPYSPTPTPPGHATPPASIVASAPWLTRVWDCVSLLNGQEARRWRLGFLVAARETDPATGKVAQPRSYRRGPSERRPVRARPPDEREAWWVGVPMLKHKRGSELGNVVDMEWRPLDELAPE